MQRTMKRSLSGAWPFFNGEVFYKRNRDSILLRCVDASKANHLMEKMHEGLLKAYASGPLLAHMIMRAGYYWLTMKSDCIKHVRTCHRCQAYQDKSSSSAFALFSSNMALLGLGYGCH